MTIKVGINGFGRMEDLLLEQGGIFQKLNLFKLMILLGVLRH